MQSSDISRCSAGTYEAGSVQDYETSDYARLHIDEIEDGTSCV